MDILRKEYCARRGSALEAFRTRAKSRGRPVTSDRPPPRRCGQAAWAAAACPIFATGEVLLVLFIFVVAVVVAAADVSGCASLSSLFLPLPPMSC